MLVRTDPFRELDRIAQAFGGATGTAARPAAVPMDAYRHGEEFVVEFDLPGVSPDAIELSVERTVLTVTAERRPPAVAERTDWQVAERTHGRFTRQLHLGESLDTDRIAADFTAGVLTLRIPVAERAKPRSINIGTGERARPTTIDA